MSYLCGKGQLSEALCRANLMSEQGVLLSTGLFYFLLQECISKKDLASGREVYGLIIRSGFQANTFLCSHLIRMFAVCGSLVEVNKVFRELPEPNVFTWSATIAAHMKLGHYEQAIELYHQMHQSYLKFDEYIFVTVLKACASLAALKKGKVIHIHMQESGFKLGNFVGSTIINMYAKCGSLVDARKVFNQLLEPNLVTWNAMITGYSQHKHEQEVLRLFQQLQQEGIEPDHVTFLSVLKACTSIEALDQGKLIHTCIIEIDLESDMFLCCTLIDMYAKCGSLEVAHRLFNKTSMRNIVIWNVLITGYAQHGHSLKAFQLFEQMQHEGMEADNVTFVGILKACSSTAELSQGKMIHVRISESSCRLDVTISNTLIAMYAKCGSLEDAHRTFKNVQKRNLVSWNTVIAGYAQHGHDHETLWLFQQMQQQGMEPDSITFLSILKVCSSVTNLEQGKLIHFLIVKRDSNLDLYIGNSLIDMYAKCASLKDAHRVFDGMNQRDVVTWNAMIAGYVQSGHSHEAFRFFLLMQQEGLEPDSVTCVSILKACSTMATLDQGKLVHAHTMRRGFDSDRFVTSTLIDMYVKCGSLSDADNVFDKWVHRDVVTWNTLISGYAHHGDYTSALQHFDNMQHEGFKPDEVTFLCLLSACSHLGFVEECYRHLKLMTENRATIPMAEHYRCFADMLGRAGCLNEAEDLVLTNPFVGPEIMAWKSLLSHCRTHGNMELGKQCFGHVVHINCQDAAGYVLMSSIYSDAGSLKDALNLEALRKDADAKKMPGKAFIGVDKEVHNFIVGDKNHPQYKDIHIKIKVLNAQLKEDGYVPDTANAR